MPSRIVATIAFLPTEEFGRASPLPQGRVGYILEIGGENFSCWVVNPGPNVIQPGDTVQLEVALAAPELAMPLLKEGADFVLKDYRHVARGVVDRVLT